jgi:hypothetical protein
MLLIYCVRLGVLLCLCLCRWLWLWLWLWLCAYACVCACVGGNCARLQQVQQVNLEDLHEAFVALGAEPVTGTLKWEVTPYISLLYRRAVYLPPPARYALQMCPQKA